MAYSELGMMRSTSSATLLGEGWVLVSWAGSGEIAVEGWSWEGLASLVGSMMPMTYLIWCHNSDETEAILK